MCPPSHVADKQHQTPYASHSHCVCQLSPVQLPAKHQRSGHSVTRYGLCDNPRGLRLPYFMGLAAGSGRPSFQLTRTAMVSIVVSMVRMSPVNRPAGVKVSIVWSSKS